MVEIQLIQLLEQMLVELALVPDFLNSEDRILRLLDSARDKLWRFRHSSKDDYRDLAEAFKKATREIARTIENREFDDDSAYECLAHHGVMVREFRAPIEQTIKRLALEMQHSNAAE